MSYFDKDQSRSCKSRQNADAYCSSPFLIKQKNRDNNILTQNAQQE
jgi:hypothetical protein